MKNFKKLINLSEQIQNYTTLKNKLIDNYSSTNFDLQEIVQNLDNLQVLYFEIQTALNYLLTCPNCAKEAKNEKTTSFYRKNISRNF